MILYVVPTPIGNLKDMTYRGVEILNEVDAILCEDTRCTLKLLNYFNIKKKLISYHKFNEYNLLDKVIKNILDGNSYALVSDAGMPGISDPGKILINECIKRGIKVDVLPGACVAINSFILSGFKSDKFTFVGFLPYQSKKIKEVIEDIKCIYTTLIIYESPHRILKTLNILKEEFCEECNIYIGRELTKKFEENFYGTIIEAIDYFNNSNIKGEFVICIENKIPDKVEVTDELILNTYNKNLEQKNLKTKDNILKISKELGVSKNYVYDLVLKEKNKHHT